MTTSAAEKAFHTAGGFLHLWLGGGEAGCEGPVLERTGLGTAWLNPILARRPRSSPPATSRARRRGRWASWRRAAPSPCRVLCLSRSLRPPQRRRFPPSPPGSSSRPLAERRAGRDSSSSEKRRREQTPVPASAARWAGGSGTAVPPGEQNDPGVVFLPGDGETNCR